MNNSKPLYIAFEGLNGSGKTTIANVLVEQDDRLVYVKEPYNQVVKSLVYTCLVQDKYVEQLAMLFTVDRMLLERHLKALGYNNKAIIFDRSVYSNVFDIMNTSLQDVLDYIAFEKSLNLTQPDFVFYIHRDNVNPTQMDRQSICQDNARAMYMKLLAQNPHTWITIDNNNDIGSAVALCQYFIDTI